LGDAPPLTSRRERGNSASSSFRRTISAIQIGAKGEVQPGEVGESASTCNRSPIASARIRLRLTP